MFQKLTEIPQEMPPIPQAVSKIHPDTFENTIHVKWVIAKKIIIHPQEEISATEQGWGGGGGLF